VLELSGSKDDFNKGSEYVESCGVKIQPLSRDIKRNEIKCTDCGVCVPMCPTDALVVDLVTRKIKFDDKKCVACEACVKICPTRAMEVHF
jgi:ferredoxin